MLLQGFCVLLIQNDPSLFICLCMGVHKINCLCLHTGIRLCQTRADSVALQALKGMIRRLFRVKATHLHLTYIRTEVSVVGILADDSLSLWDRPHHDTVLCEVLDFCSFSLQLHRMSFSVTHPNKDLSENSCSVCL